MGKRLLRIFVLLVLFTFFPGKNLISQFTHLLPEDGLSQNQIFSIIQDNRGFIWIGTLDGLNKFNGYTCKIIKKDPLRELTLSDNNILSMCVDNNGIIWIGTEGGGLNRLDPVTEKFKVFKNNRSDPSSLPNDFVRVIYTDSTGFLWIGTDGGGLCRLDPVSGKFHPIPLYGQDAGDKNKNYIKAIAQDYEGDLWVGTAGGLLQIDIKTEKIECYNHRLDDPHGLSHNLVEALLIDKKGTLWVGTFNGLNRLVKDNKTFEYIHLNNGISPDIRSPQISSLFEDSQGQIWIGTNGNGLHQISQKQEIITHYTLDLTDPESLSDNNINTIFEDKSGVLWFGTERGVNKLSARRKVFNNVKNRPLDENSLSDNGVWNIFEDHQGTLWVGTEFGLNQMDTKRGTFKKFFHEPDNPNSLSHNTVRAIFEDSNQNLWIGTDGGGLNLYDRRKNKFSSYKSVPGDPKSISSNQLRYIYEDKAHSLWIGTVDGGLNLWNPIEKNFTVYLNDPADPDSLGNNNVYTILEDSKGIFWVGTLGGLSYLDRKTGKFKTFRHTISDPHSISDNGIGCVFEDSKHNLWIGTDRGINLFNRENDTFSSYTMADGLPNDFIYGILEDNQGYLWLSTNRGLSRFNVRTRSFRNYDYYDGLQGQEFNAGAYLKSKDGTLYFGGLNGFNYFLPGQLKDNIFIPPVVLTAFRKFNIPSNLGKVVSEVEKIKLSYKDNSFSFEFAALDYNAPEKNQYMFKMDGFDSDWQMNGNQRHTTYTNLDPGVYTFRVKGSNNDGVWNESGFAVQIEITPPFWKYSWFKIVVLILASGALLFFYRSKIRKIKKQTRRLEKLVSERTQQLQAANAELERLAKEDGLTGIANFRTMQNYLSVEIKRSQRSKEPISFIMLDVDHFKIYNDEYGHLAGDECLIKLARILDSTVNRPSDLVARYGGEEFAIILPNTDVQGAIFIAGKIKGNIMKAKIPFTKAPKTSFLTASLGVATFIPSKKMETTSLISAADQALYKAKNKGRNRIHIYNTDETL
jgi:diguanylate cyclase (GGDEF)-like protein